MKASLPAILIMILFFLSANISAQSTCKVLMADIAGTYNGECKKGLADGEGEAYGKDSYTGSFRKGLPDGEGTYTWAYGAVYTGRWKKGMRDGYGTYRFMTNGRDSVQTGYWKENRYIGTELVSPYKVTFRLGIGRTTFSRFEHNEEYVSFKFTRAGEVSYSINELMMQGSSGTETITTAFTGFQNVSFPFECKVQFKAPNFLNTTVNSYELRFIINEPGAWVVTVYY